ncbi:KxYKxGKxW signal peptide domain-containing protein, partial [Lactococcus lactis]|uniref:KxYKxGKxW signal peptide domain-containing protein n=1 Tax=Lactococcus lactis TaxID=1358 RepID=UPI0019106ECD
MNKKKGLIKQVTRFKMHKSGKFWVISSLTHLSWLNLSKKSAQQVKAEIKETSYQLLYGEEDETTHKTRFGSGLKALTGLVAGLGLGAGISQGQTYAETTQPSVEKQSGKETLAQKNSVAIKLETSESETNTSSVSESLPGSSSDSVSVSESLLTSDSLNNIETKAFNISAPSILDYGSYKGQVEDYKSQGYTVVAIMDEHTSGEGTILANNLTNINSLSTSSSLVVVQRSGSVGQPANAYRLVLSDISNTRFLTSEGTPYQYTEVTYVWKVSAGFLGDIAPNTNNSPLSKLMVAVDNSKNEVSGQFIDPSFINQSNFTPVNIYGDTSESLSTSTSGSISASTSTSGSISKSQSISISESEVISESKSNSNSVSGSLSISMSESKSLSDSLSGSQSISISASESTSDLESISSSESLSETLSESSSESISVSQSISGSESTSESEGISESESISNSVSDSLSASMSESESLSNSLSGSQSVSISESNRNSISDSASVSNSTSDSNRVSNSESSSLS